jgi:hypothetical protein
MSGEQSLTAVAAVPAADVPATERFTSDEMEG